MAGLAFMLACAVCGFGGAYTALNVYGESDNTTVVYRAPEITTTGSGGQSDTLTTSEVAELASQSVVSINSEFTVSGFGKQYVSEGAGSGVILSEDGYIITNNHVVSDATKISVVLPDGSEHEAVVVGTAPANDIAVIKIDVTGLIPAVLGDSSALRVGQECLAIGNSMGTLSNTVTDGIISALDRELSIDGYNMTLVQTSAAISPGNSGGGLFNMSGELVGIVNAKASGDDAEGLGFAIPINTAMEIAQQLIENTDTTQRPGIGVTLLNALTAEQAAQYGLDDTGVYISEVNAGGAGKAAGLLAGDKILAADGRTIQQTSDLSAVLESKNVGDSLTLSIQRGEEQLEITVTLVGLTQTA